jgi:hypothetical protein
VTNGFFGSRKLTLLIADFAGERGGSRIGGLRGRLAGSGFLCNRFRWRPSAAWERGRKLARLLKFGEAFAPWGSIGPAVAGVLLPIDRELVLEASSLEDVGESLCNE